MTTSGQSPSLHRRPRLVMVSHLVPIKNADNAGQNLVTAMTQHWSHSHDVSVIVLPGRSSAEQLGSAVAPANVLQTDDTSRLAAVRLRVSQRLLRSFPGVPYPTQAHSLGADPTARQMIESADVVVLQWQREAGQAPTIRRINPNATIVSVLHDVDSQALARRASGARTLQDRIKFAIQRRAAELAERRILRASDVTIVLSDKDAALLPRGLGRIHVVPPPIAVPDVPLRRPTLGRVLFVAGARPENEDALRWFVREVEPHLHGFQRENLHVIGKQTAAAQAEFAAAGFTMRGFVDDLAAEYSQAAVAVVPLRLGAGVKFKTLEAILHGVPVVTTAVGAEGITGLAGSRDVTDAPEAFANRLGAFLADTTVAEDNAQTLRARVVEHHGPEAFSRAMDEVLT